MPCETAKGRLVNKILLARNEHLQSFGLTENAYKGLMVCDQGEMSSVKVRMELLDSKDDSKGLLVDLRVVSLGFCQCARSERYPSFRSIFKCMGEYG